MSIKSHLERQMQSQCNTMLITHYVEMIKKCKNKADAKMVEALDSIPWKERQWGHAGVRNVIAAKQKFSLGMKKK